VLTEESASADFTFDMKYFVGL